MKGICGAADVVVAVQGDDAAGWNDCSRTDLVVVREDEPWAEPEPATEGKPIERSVTCAHLEFGADVGSLFLKRG